MLPEKEVCRVDTLVRYPECLIELGFRSGCTVEDHSLKDGQFVADRSQKILNILDGLNPRSILIASLLGLRRTTVLSYLLSDRLFVG